MKTRSILLSCCLFAVACGGGGRGGEHVNAAANRTFTYGEPQAAYSIPPSADSAIVSALALDAQADESSALAMQGTLLAAADEALGESIGFSTLPVESGSNALVSARREVLLSALRSRVATLPEACVAVVHTGETVKVTYTNCVYSYSEEGDTLTVSVSGVVNAGPGAVDWDLTERLTLASTDMSMAVTLDDAGDLAITSSTAVGHEEASLAMSLNFDGQRYDIGMDQAADLSVTHDAACGTRITGGTLEARRVWTKLPSEARDEPEFRNAAAKFTWTGCGTATVQYSVN